MMFRLVGLVTGLALACVTATTDLQAASKPNIVMILVDDWGYYDLNYRRTEPDAEKLPTPNMDSLIAEGLLLDQAYSYHWCTPSRSSFLSGRLPLHVFQNGVPSETVWDDLHPEKSGNGIPRNMTTIPKFLSKAGYVTMAAGKWHAGFATKEHTPRGRGFHRALNYLSGANNYRTYNITDGAFKLFPKECNTPTKTEQTDGFVDLFENSGPMPNPPFGTYEDDFLAAAVNDFINETSKGDAPFFVYWTPHLVHAPLTAPEEYMKKFAYINDPIRQRYHAMVNKLDDLIGDLITTLKMTGEWDNTWIVVQSDNGGPLYGCKAGVALDDNPLCGGASNHPLRGSKTSPWQGGIRVNAFVSGGALPAHRRGQVEPGFLHLADYLATFCEMAGVEGCDHDPAAAAADLPQPDSLSMYDLIMGSNSTSPRTEYPVTGTLPGGHSLIQVTDDGSMLKVLTGQVGLSVWPGLQFPNASSPMNGTGFPINSNVMNCTLGCLFNLTSDPTEHLDIAKDNPDLLSSMMDRLTYWEKDTFSPFRGLPHADACAVMRLHYGEHQFGPFIDV